MANELAGKVAIVTGGARGIGRASVELFVEEGAKVVIADLHDDEGEALAKELGSAVRYKRTDISKRDEVQALVDFAVAQFGGLHIMFNNAGIGDTRLPFLEEEFADFQRVIDVNLRGVMLGSQIAARQMVKQGGGGSIINTSSIAATDPVPHGFVYGATKAAVNNFTRSIAIALGPQLIRCNAILPGNIPTSIGLYNAPGATPEQIKQLEINVKAVRMAHQPLKRQGAGRDIAQAALFLGSDRSAYITGQIIAADAGATAGNVSNIGAELAAARTAALEGA
jgi:NAD(P)-dependent dehydrogenase (short-subunit alcohol dehydrogenase family)